MSLFGCCGVGLGSVLGAISANLAAIVRPSWSRNSLRKSEYYETCLNVFRPDGTPKRIQDHSKIILDRFSAPLEFSILLLIVADSVLGTFGMSKAPGGMRTLPLGSLWASKTVSGSS